MNASPGRAKEVLNTIFFRPFRARKLAAIYLSAFQARVCILLVSA